MTAPVRGGHITQEYGVPGNYAAGYHTGRDWAGGTGDIVAARGGQVTYAGWAGDYGNRIEIITNGIQHSYSHLSTMNVWVGQQVMEGSYLGMMGSTGNSTGPHCHYEERFSPYGYYNHRPPQFDISSGTQPDPAPQPPDDEEEDDVKPYVVNDGTSIWLSDLATWKTGIKDYRVSDNGISAGVYVQFNNGNPVSSNWAELVARLPTIA